MPLVDFKMDKPDSIHEPLPARMQLAYYANTGQWLKYAETLAEAYPEEDSDD